MKKALFIIIIAAFCSSCEMDDKPKESLQNYKGFVVIQKDGKWWTGDKAKSIAYAVKVQKGVDVRFVWTTEYDYTRYNIGDTIR